MTVVPATDIGCPVVHQQAPTFEQVGARVGRLGLVPHHVRQRRLDHLPRVVCPFRGPVPEAGPESVRQAPIPSCCNTPDSRASPIALPRWLGNTRPDGMTPVEATPSRRASSRISTARLLSGIRCSRPALVRAAGTVPRDPGGAVEGVAGPQEREAGEAAHQGSDAAPARLVADAVRAGAGNLLGDAGSASGCRPQSTSVPHRHNRTVTSTGPRVHGRGRGVGGRRGVGGVAGSTWTNPDPCAVAYADQGWRRLDLACLGDSRQNESLVPPDPEVNRRGRFGDRLRIEEESVVLRAGLDNAGWSCFAHERRAQRCGL